MIGTYYIEIVAPLMFFAPLRSLRLFSCACQVSSVYAMCVCVCVCVVCVYVCMCTHVCVYVYSYMCIYAVCIHIYVNTVDLFQ